MYIYTDHSIEVFYENESELVIPNLFNTDHLWLVFKRKEGSTYIFDQVAIDVPSTSDFEYALRGRKKTPFSEEAYSNQRFHLFYKDGKYWIGQKGNYLTSLPKTIKITKLSAHI